MSAAAKLMRPTLAIVVVAVLLSGAGCRVFHTRKVSEVSIAAARQLSLQGIDAQQRGRWDQAEGLFAAAIVKCPIDERARFGYAEALWHRGAHADAIVQMEEAVRLSANDPERMVALGQMYRQQGDLRRAAAQAEQAIGANPRLAGAWALRGAVQQAQGNRSEALSSYHRALSYQPTFPEVQLAVADIYAAENRPQRALATLSALTAGLPPGQSPSEIVIRKCQALQALGRHDEAIELAAHIEQRDNVRVAAAEAELPK